MSAIRPLHILILEDNPLDAELLSHTLTQANLEFEAVRVDNETDFTNQLSENPNLILADYSLPQFNALQALQMLHEHGLDIPFIVVTGAVSEENAVECIKQGAVDYLLKDRLSRLGSAVIKALAEKGLREERRRAEDERRRVEEALWDSEARFHAMFDKAAIGIALVDKQGYPLECNDALQRMLGYSQEELRGLNFKQFTDPQDVDSDWLLYQDLLAGKRDSYQIEKRYVHKDGHLVWGQLTVSLVRDADAQPRFGIGMLEDITERKRAEANLRQSQSSEYEQRIVAETLRDTAAILTSSLDPETVMNQILDNVGRVVPHDAAAIKLIEGDYARVAYARGWSPDDAVSLSYIRLPLSNPVVHALLTGSRSLFIADTQSYPGWVSVIPRLRSYASAPIRVHGQIIGFLDVDSVTPGFFTARHSEHLQAFADQAGIALENAQLYDALQRSAVELQQRVEKRTVELNRMKEHAEAILTNSSDGILVIRADGTISQVNPAAEALFGYSVAALVDRPWTVLVKAAMVETLRQALASLWTSEQTVRVELEACRKDGTTFLADFGVARVTLQQADTGTAQSIEFVCNMRDITARQRADEELRRSLEQQKELVALKSHFIAMASHDFRTPLTVILTSCELLKLELTRLPREKMPEILEKRLAKIRESIRNMTELIDDVLTINVIDSGHLKLKMETLDLKSFCQDILDEIRPATGIQNALAFTLEGSRTTFVADRHLFRQVLVNLLTNAIKYSPAGGNVYLNVQGDAEQVIFKVRDEGIGIPEQDQPRLFEIFYRASNVGNISGTGLGLAIMKRNVEALGGTIHVQSRVGAGTTFTVSIPVKTIS